MGTIKQVILVSGRYIVNRQCLIYVLIILTVAPCSAERKVKPTSTKLDDQFSANQFSITAPNPQTNNSPLNFNYHRDMLIQNITNNITKMVSDYNTNDTHHLLNIPEHLWELTDSQETSSELSSLTPDDITTLKHELDNLESYKNLQKLSEGMVPVISVTDVESFNDFITGITNKGLRLRNQNQEVLKVGTVKLESVLDKNKDSIMQVFQSLSDEREVKEQNMMDRVDNGMEVTINSESGVNVESAEKYETSSTETSQAGSDSQINLNSNANKTIPDWIEILQTKSPTNETNTTHVNIPDIEQILEFYYENISLPKPIKYLSLHPITENTTSYTLPELPTPIKFSYYNNERINNINNLNDTDEEEVQVNLLSRENEHFRLKEIKAATEWGIEKMNSFFGIREPELYHMGLSLDKDHPGQLLASFNNQTAKAREISKFGYASLQATTKLLSDYADDEDRISPKSNPFAEVAATLRQSTLEQCPFRGPVRCPPPSQRYRTADGTCNNPLDPRRGSTMLPMIRFLPPQYNDGIQSIRRSVRTNGPLPSARDISSTIHSDRDIELTSITHLLMNWGQFLDHDLTQTAQSRGFNGSVPRCCRNGGQNFQPIDDMHPDCLPIEVSPNDWFLSEFGTRCMEFIRSAPASRVDCSLGWREQINQVTAYLDGSQIYGTSVEQADNLRTFQNGLLAYGRTNPTSSSDESERCQRGANSPNCFQSGDSRSAEQPGLTALHISWIRQHNQIAAFLSQLNLHWSDEKTYQETRRIIGAMLQHITYREFLPIVLGPEVVQLFGIDLLRQGYFDKYDPNVQPGPANEFAAAAFRFGHSLVQHSFIRADSNHRLLTNNVTLHNEPVNVENIWTFGSVDRLLLGMCNQPSQKRDEFISEELTNHLFQTSRVPFGMDLASINIQRGRDHGLPSYTSWRKPCGLSLVTSWQDLTKIMSIPTVTKLQTLYEHYEDIDLFTGGLAEKPVRGGLVGPTFACIIAQQFSNLRRADRFWYENGKSEASFTPEQLQEIRKITLSQVLCRTMDEFNTIQPFVFLTPDHFRNKRILCSDPIYNSFSLEPWKENPKFHNLISNKGSTKPTARPIEGFLNSIKQKFGFVQPIESAKDNLNSKNISKRADVGQGLQVTTTKIETKAIEDHGYGNSDWYDELPTKSKVKPKPEPLLALAPQRDYFTTPSYYGGLQTFQSVASPTRRPPPSSSNPFLDEIDLTYDLTQNKPTPDIEYLIGIVSNDNKRKDQLPSAQTSYGVQPVSYDQSIKPQFNYRPTEYYQTTRPYNDYLTTKRYSVRTTPKPFPTGFPPLNNPIENNYNSYDYRPTRRPTNRPVLQDEDINAVYGQLPNPNFGRPTTTRRPTFDFDSNPNLFDDSISANSNPNSYDAPIRPSVNTYGDRYKPTSNIPEYGNNNQGVPNRPVYQDHPLTYQNQPVKLFYIGNVLHKVKDGSIVPVKRYEVVSQSSQKHQDPGFIKISSVSGQYATSGDNKNTYINIKSHYQKENRQDDLDTKDLVETIMGDYDDLEIDESVHLYEASIQNQMLNTTSSPSITTLRNDLELTNRPTDTTEIP